MSSLERAVNTITLRQLQYFVAVAEDEHFTRASERLIIAQPSLSRQIKDLERALGAELFERDTRGVRLTDAGRDLLIRTRRVFSMLESAIDAVRSAAEGESGRLRLGLFGPTFYHNKVTRCALERFRTDAPGVEVVSNELFTEQMAPALYDDQIDVGFSRGIAHSSDVESRLIHIERLVVLLPQGDDLASQRTVALGDLNGRNLISFARKVALPLNERIADVARQARVRLNHTVEVTQLLSIAGCVNRGEGIAILPKSSTQFPFQGVEVREISDAHATVDIFMLTRRGEQSPVVHRFLDMIDLHTAVMHTGGSRLGR